VSERKPQRELLNPRIGERSAVQAKATIVGTVVNRVGVKAHRICDVEDLPGEFQ